LEDERLLLVEGVREYAIFMLLPDGVIATWNPGGERIKGYAAAEIIGRHFSVFFLSDDVAAGKPQALLDRARRDGQARDQGWRLRKDGTRFWADVLVTALVDDLGELYGFAKLTRDETERRDAEEQSRVLERLAERQELSSSLQLQVIKRIFGAGLTLDSALTLVHDPAARDRIEAAISELDETVREIRVSLFASGPETL
jgi:PAS domain S-box-containing protein